jgi:hypothetical protein
MDLTKKFGEIQHRFIWRKTENFMQLTTAHFAIILQPFLWQSLPYRISQRTFQRIVGFVTLTIGEPLFYIPTYFEVPNKRADRNKRAD